MSDVPEGPLFEFYARGLHAAKDGGDIPYIAQKFAQRGVTELVAESDVRDALYAIALDREPALRESKSKRKRVKREIEDGLDLGNRYRTGHLLDEDSLERAGRLSDEVERQTLRLEAADIVRAARVEPVEIPPFVRFCDVAEDDEPATPFLIEGLFPARGSVLLAAQFKAGKSTMGHNLARSLVDGVDFLDEFPVNAGRRVALLDFELSKPTLETWVRGQGIRNTDRLTLVSLRGRAAAFNILDDATRTRWADLFREAEIETLIVDPLRPILAALNLNEWNETGPLLQAFDALKEEAGISELALFQHYGHHAQRAAGDSRLLGWADAIWNLTLEYPSDSRSFRFFEAYGRDVDQQRGLVSLYDERRLAFAHDAGMSKDERYIETLLDWLLTHPDAKRTDIESAGLKGINSKSFIRIRDKAADRLIERTGGNNAKHYSVAPVLEIDSEAPVTKSKKSKKEQEP